MNEASEEGRKREYQRQQDRLKMMAPEAEKRLVSADAMINTLLEKSDTFRKVKNDLPPWLRVDSACPYYNQIWEVVRSSDTMVDTAKISQLLLTSGLHPDVLGYIWNLANKALPGQLTKQELFIVLALVGLAQGGYSFNNLSVLNVVASAPVPRLLVPFQPSIPTALHNSGQVVLPKMHPSSNIPTSHIAQSGGYDLDELQSKLTILEDDDFDDFQSVAPQDIRPSQPKDEFVEKSVPGAALDLLKGKAESPLQNDSLVDEFTDFQSADMFDTSIVQPSPLASLPKLSSFIKVSPESERRLRNLAQPEKLTALPESKISSRNKVQTMPMMGASRSVGSRLANHSLGSKVGKATKQIKLKPIVAANTASIPSKDLFPKCVKPGKFLLKETKIPSLESESDHELTRKIQIPIVGTFKETTLPANSEKLNTDSFERNEPNESVFGMAKQEAEFSENELMSVAEDKYGALREISLAGKTDEPKEEDFGDFLSADLTSEKTVEAWAVWNSSIMPEAKTCEENSTVREISLAISEDVKTNDAEEKPPDDDSTSRFDLQKVSSNFDLLVDLKISPMAPEAQEHSSTKWASMPAEQNCSNTKPIYDLLEDDFGDFVAPVSVLREDALSVNSLNSINEVGPTRQGSFSSASDKDSGEKGSRRSSVPSLKLQVEDVWNMTALRVVQCCHDLLKEGVEIFESVVDKAVLSEVFTTSHARNYINYLSVAYSISRRITQNSAGSFNLFNDITRQWEFIRRIADEFSVPVNDCDSSQENGSEPCALCRGSTSNDDLDKDGVKFHVSCANLWVNCVERSLPCF